MEVQQAGPAPEAARPVRLQEPWGRSPRTPWAMRVSTEQVLLVMVTDLVISEIQPSAMVTLEKTPGYSLG